jgi:hypothetical protein
MTRLLAWLALCGVSSALAVIWWPVGMIPAVVLVLLALGFVRRRNAPPC